MTMTLHHGSAAASKRAADRERKRAEREHARAEAIPHSTLVDAAVSEAVSFCITSSTSGDPETRHAWQAAGAQISSVLLFNVALSILVHRHRKNAKHSAQALKAKLQVRAEHKWPRNVPTIHVKPLAEPLFDNAVVRPAHDPDDHDDGDYLVDVLLAQYLDQADPDDDDDDPF